MTAGACLKTAASMLLIVASAAPFAAVTPGIADAYRAAEARDERPGGAPTNAVDGAPAFPPAVSTPHRPRSSRVP
jgi:hypothetical protein